MKLPSNINLPADVHQMSVKLNDVLADICQQVNRLTEGTVFAVHNAQTAAPTTGTYAQGDFIRKSNTVEAGSASSKYVIIGWVCTVAGSPGTWLECRVLTGN